MAIQITWRVQHIPEAITDEETWERGLAIHLDHVPIISTLMQIGDQRRTYITTEGCDGCSLERCQPGCPSMLLRQMAAAAAPNAQITYISRGIVARRYEQIHFLLPKNTHEELHPDEFTGATDLRLDLRWVQAGRHRAISGILGITGAQTHKKYIESKGWRAIPIHPLIARPILKNMLHPPGVMLTPTKLHPYLLGEKEPATS